MMDVAPLTFLLVFIVCTVGAWIVSKFFTQIVTLAIKVTTGNSLSFRVLGLLKIKDIHCAFKKGPIQSVTIREVKGHLAAISSLKFRLRIKIKDVDIVLRPSPPSTSKKKKKTSSPRRKAGAIAAAWGRWKLLGSFFRMVRLCVFDVSVRSTQAPDVCFQLREFDLFSTADTAGKGQLAMRLELLGISLSHRPSSSKKGPAPRSREVGIATRLVHVQWSELELNLSERLLALRIVKPPKRPPAAQPTPAAAAAAAAVADVPVLVNEKKRPNLPEKSPCRASWCACGTTTAASYCAAAVAQSPSPPRSLARPPTSL
ncbi:hypothetical protein CLOM_g2696 [Closterium sp. NIES-68]|nr:hypothetical protein CLOM_g2696 [Closterium sp. NIES-68]